jgi:hypothetical protein
MSGGVVREPLRIRVADEQQAASLARTLNELVGFRVHCDIGGCEIAVDGADSGKTLPVVLDAIRDTLAGEPTSSASVLLDGREYHMRGGEPITMPPSDRRRSPGAGQRT